MEALRPKRRYRFVIFVFILLTVLLPREQLQAFSVTIYQSQLASVSEAKQSFFCKAFGWLLTPLGFCEEPSEDGVEDPQSAEPGTPAAPQSEPDETETAPPPVVATPHPPATTSPQIIRETPIYITNEHITNPTTVIREVVQETVYRNGGSASIDTSGFATRDNLTRQVELIFDSQSDFQDDLAAAVNTALLTVAGNAVIGGTLSVAGATALDTTLDVSGPSTLATTSATQLTASGNATVNGATTLAGSLSLAGTATFSDLAGGFLTTDSSGVLSTSTIAASNLDLPHGYVFRGGTDNQAEATSSLFVADSGNTGLGTTTPGSRLTVAGGASVTGTATTTDLKRPGFTGE